MLATLPTGRGRKGKGRWQAVPKDRVSRFQIEAAFQAILVSCSKNHYSMVRINKVWSPKLGFFCSFNSCLLQFYLILFLLHRNYPASFFVSLTLTSKMPSPYVCTYQNAGSTWHSSLDYYGFSFFLSFFNLGISLTTAFLNLSSSREATIKVTITRVDTGYTLFMGRWGTKNEQPDGWQVGKLGLETSLSTRGLFITRLGWLHSPNYMKALQPGTKLGTNEHLVLTYSQYWIVFFKF